MKNKIGLPNLLQSPGYKSGTLLRSHLYHPPLYHLPALPSSHLLVTLKKMSAAPEILSWTNQDPRESQLYNTWGVLYRFQVNSSMFIPIFLLLTSMQTVVGQDGLSTTTLFRALRKGKEERVARLEWAPNGGLGRAQIGKVRWLSSHESDKY